MGTIRETRERLKTTEATLERLALVSSGFTHREHGLDEHTVATWQSWGREIRHLLDAAEHGWIQAIAALGLALTELPDDHPALDTDPMEAPGRAQALIRDMEIRLAGISPAARTAIH